MCSVTINNRYSNIYLRDTTIIVTLSNITRTGLIVCIKDPKEAFSVDYNHIEDTEVEETTIVDIITTTHFIGSNAIFIINLNAS
jgi:hypothetical protein